MTPRQFLSILAARWRVALLVLILSVVGTAAVSVKLLKQYTASASVMLDARSAEQITGGAVNAGMPIGYMATQMDLIMSERVARGVITALGLDKDAHQRERWFEAGGGSGDFEAWLAEQLLKGLVVRPAAASNVITIAYTAADGQRAAELANVFLKAYIDTSLEMRMERVREYGVFFEERAKQLRDELQAAQSKLSAYQQQNGLVGRDEGVLDVERTRLAELISQWAQLQGASAEFVGRLRQASQQPEQLQEVMTNPAVAALSAELMREEIRIQELASRLGENHPQIVEQRVRIAELKARLAAATARASGSMGNSANNARLAQLTATLNAQRERVLRIQTLREHAVVLQREVENAQRAYDAMLVRVNQSNIESQNSYTNVAVLKRATAPMAPSSPNLLKNIAASLVLGATLGVGAALGLEHLDRRMRTPDDLAQLELPLLVALPVSAHARRLADTPRMRLMKRRVMTGLPRPNQPA